MNDERESRTRRTPKLKCPHCGWFHSFVIYTDPDLYGTFIARRRRCHHCGRDFRTKERIDDPSVNSSEKLQRDDI